LVFVRRVRSSNQELLQGFVGDWPALERGLLAEVADLVQGARLEARQPGRGEDPVGLSLATLPAALIVPPAPAAPSLARDAPWNLLLPWAGTLLALLAVAWTLRATQVTGERRSRFASSVTHELRTPLTTFRMYSEMLARGMVPESKRALYLRTLEQESGRLADLVESVLAYSRLEDGRSRARCRRLPAEKLIEDLRPALEQRAQAADANLMVIGEVPSGIDLHTDPEAVGRILLNLVDNACKYGLDGGRELRLELSVRKDRLEIRVCDEGRGIPIRRRRRIFEAFERGEEVAHAAGDAQAGLGLGLSLSRGLARDLGGELELERPRARGAVFLLRLPILPAGLRH
jgi:signal transduction histidine kinase